MNEVFEISLQNISKLGSVKVSSTTSVRKSVHVQVKRPNPISDTFREELIWQTHQMLSI